MTIVFSWTLIEQYFDHCPEQARQVYVLKTAKKTYSAGQSTGINTHAAIDNHIRKHDLLPESLEWLAPTLKAFTSAGEATSEKTLAVDHMLEPSTFFADKKGRDPYIRGKWDLAVKSGTNGFLVDWKDGKKWEKEGQLELGALLWMRNDPSIQQVTGVNFWLQDRTWTTPPYVTTQAQASKLWGQKWLPRLREIEAKNPNEPWHKNPVPWRCSSCPVVTCAHNPKYQGV
jgi:hypothetical protein